MSSRIETTVAMSIAVLARRGGDMGRLADGWGVVFHDGADIRLFREPAPAGQSALVRHLAANPQHSSLVISHLRHATQGEVALRNTQPFARELGARMHVFAHNGNLPGIAAHRPGTAERFRPIGATDSEVAFCILMERMASLWRTSVPPLVARLAVVTAFAAQLRALGPANFLYADGDALFAHAHRRIQPDGAIAPPGLHMLARTCDVDPDALADAGIRLGTPQAVTLVASVPLTNEAWRPLDEGEVVVVHAGEVVERPVTG